MELVKTHLLHVFQSERVIAFTLVHKKYLLLYSKATWADFLHPST